MVQHTQIIRRQKPTNFLSVFVHFVGLVMEKFLVLRIINFTFFIFQNIYLKKKDYWRNNSHAVYSKF